MTRSIGPLLPDSLVTLLSGEDLQQSIDMAFECLTITEHGWPYVAMVSVGELLATSPSALRLGIWSTSTTAANLEREERCVLSLVHQQTAYSIRCETRSLGLLEAESGPTLAVFALSASDVLEDSAPYATLTSGVTYALHDPDSVLPRWERTVAALRRFA